MNRDLPVQDCIPWRVYQEAWHASLTTIIFVTFGAVIGPLHCQTSTYEAIWVLKTVGILAM